MKQIRKNVPSSFAQELREQTINLIKNYRINTAEKNSEYGLWKNIKFDSNTGLLSIYSGELNQTSLQSVNKHLVKKIRFFKGVKFPKCSSHLFADFISLIEIEGLEQVNTAQVNDISGMFKNCRSLSKLDLSHFDTSKVKYMNDLFSDNRSLKAITLGLKSQFSNKVYLPLVDIHLDKYTGRWIGKHSQNIYYDSYSFMTDYDGEVPDTYIWERKNHRNN